MHRFREGIPWVFLKLQEKVARHANLTKTIYGNKSVCQPVCMIWDGSKRTLPKYIYPNQLEQSRPKNYGFALRW